MEERWVEEEDKDEAACRLAWPNRPEGCGPGVHDNIVLLLVLLLPFGLGSSCHPRPILER